MAGRLEARIDHSAGTEEKTIGESHRMGARKPERIDPFSAAKIEMSTAIVTAPATRPVRSKCDIISAATRLLAATCPGLEHIEVCNVDQQVRHDHSPTVPKIRARGRLRSGWGLRNYADVIPAVVGPGAHPPWLRKSPPPALTT